MLETPPISQLSQVISELIAPAFVLGAVSGFISVLVTRLNRIIDRCRTLAASEHDHQPAHLAADIGPRLNTRADLINRSILFAVASGLATLLLMIVAFVDAFFNLAHERGVAFLFVVALALFCASLVYFGRELHIAIRDPNNFD